MIVPPGSTIGIIGGGQLGRMLALAAAQLGYRCHVYAPDDAGSAAQVAARVTRGAFDDAAAIARFAAAVDVVTYEFENVPTAPLKAIAALHPPLEALEIAQDRLAEKNFILRHGGRPARFAAVDDRAGLDATLAEIGAPAILKTRRFGYDGKGQARIAAAADAEAAWAAVKGAPSVLEALVPFDAEFSILLCRGADGETVTWDAPVNRHEGGILATSTLPAPAALAPAIAEA
jgi:5-(carboxyamino)imidazole ribonucleotide synthase